jgi:hypothetical protein
MCALLIDAVYFGTLDFLQDQIIRLLCMDLVMHECLEFTMCSASGGRNFASE